MSGLTTHSRFGRPTVLLLPLLALWLAACPRPPVRDVTPPADKACRRNVPPGDLNEFESEMAYASTTDGGAVNIGMDAARERLLERLAGKRLPTQVCGYAQLVSLVQSWEMCPDGKLVQLRAVARKSDVERWHKDNNDERHVAQQDAQLKVMLDSAKTTNSWPKGAVVRVKRPNQGTDPGGSLAEWLVQAAVRSLVRADLSYEDDTSGQSMAIAHLKAVVGRTASTRDQTYNVQWQLCLLAPPVPGQADRREEVCSSTDIRLPQCLFPDGPASDSEAAADSPDLRLTIAGVSAGGSACEGDLVKLTLEVQRPLYVRIYNLFGDDDGVVMYPLYSNPLLVDPIRPLVIDNMPVVFTGSQRERYLVLAADNAAALQSFPAPTPDQKPCKFDGPRAKKLHALREPPNGLLWAQTGFYIRNGAGCPLASVAAQEERDDAMAALQSYPQCR
jgi:hypothetical protein